MRLLYRFIILIIIVLLAFYLVMFPISKGSLEVLSNLKDPVRDRYAFQEGIARDYLTEGRQLIYDAMYMAIDEGIEKINLPVKGYSENDIEKVLLSLLSDCPSIFWMDFANCSYIENDEGITVFFSYFYSGDTLKNMRLNLKSEVISIVQTIEAGSYSSEYEKALYAHDMIAFMCEYDKAQDGKDMHNAYGALVTRKAVCDGYAHAYQLILEELGLECHYVAGEARGPNGPEGHAWNIAKLDGKYTSIDLTWNDIDGYMFEGFVPPSDDISSHVYFGISEDEIRQTHTVDDKQVYPLPEAKEMSWYSFNNLKGSSVEEIKDKASDVLIKNMKIDISYVEIELTSREVFQGFLEEYSGDIIDLANSKLEEQGNEKRFKPEMNCFVTNSDKGCILIVVEIEV